MNTFAHQIEDATFYQKSASPMILPGGRHPNDIRCLAVTEDTTVWIGTAEGLFTFSEYSFERLDDSACGCSDIKCFHIDDDRTLWTGTGLTLASRAPNGTFQIHLEDTWDDGAVVAVARSNGNLIVATSERGLCQIKEGRLQGLADGYPSGKRIFRLKHDTNGLFILGEAGIHILDSDLSVIRQDLQHLQVRDVYRDGSVLFYGSSDGLYKEEPGQPLRKVNTPIRDIHSVTRTSLGLTCGTSSGYFIHSDDRWHYFGGLRWLPSDDVRDIVELDDTTFSATGKGLGRVHRKPLTLEQKEVGFEERIRDRHLRLKGYVATSTLERPGDLTSNRTRPSDNDGLWTALYLAAQSYRFAVTKSDEARAWAFQAFDAIEWLEGVTTIEGFPTKAIVAAGDDTGSDAVAWYPSAGGSWLWKGDCSSDEIDGHMYGYSIFFDLAADDAYRQRIIELVNRIMGPIIENNYLLLGMDGKPTRWGVWSPDYLNGPWRSQRGLNSLEILSHLKTAFHITRETRYTDAYRDLIETHGYAENARRQKLTLPGHVNHSDDELAFISYYPLLKYEEDEHLRQIYLESLEHAWQIERPERNPWWNYIYGVLTGSDCDAELAAQTLREIPTDLIDWPIRNSHRMDIRMDAERGRKGELQSVKVLPYDELPATKLNLNPYSLDADTNAQNEDDGTYYLLPYWMGRHYGFLTEGRQ